VEQENLSDEGKSLNSAVEDWRSSGVARLLHGVRRGHRAVDREQAEDRHYYAEPSTKENEFAKESHPENDLDHDAKEEKTGGEARERADACACAFGLTAAHAY